MNLVDIGNKFNCTVLNIQNCTNMTSLNGISSMSNLAEIYCVNDTSLVNITGVGSLTSLTKLTLDTCGITNLSEIRNLSNLDSISLKNNPLANKDGDIDNLQILADLRTNKSNLKVYLSGCKNILDWSKLSSFGSWWKDSEKAGY